MEPSHVVMGLEGSFGKDPELEPQKRKPVMQSQKPKNWHSARQQQFWEMLEEDFEAGVFE